MKRNVHILGIVNLTDDSYYAPSRAASCEAFLERVRRMVAEGADVVDIGATLDERIADGFYFARSLKLVKHIFANPALLDRPLGEPSGFEYK